MESRYFVIENEGRLDYDEIMKRDKRLREELRIESELAFEIFKAKAVVYAKEHKEREEREELERIEKAKQKEIDRVEQLKKHNLYNDTFIDPITSEETSIEDGIILDTKLYSIATLRNEFNQRRKFPRVPHNKRWLNNEEIEFIGGIYPGPDSRICPEYYETESDYDSGYSSCSDYDYDSDYNYISDYEYDYEPKALPPPHVISERTMTWDVFATFIQEIPSYFLNNTIDSLIDEKFVVSGVLVIITVRRYSQNANGDRENVFDIHINVDGERFYKRERADHNRIDVRFLCRVKKHSLFRELDKYRN